MDLRQLAAPLELLWEAPVALALVDRALRVVHATRELVVLAGAPDAGLGLPLAEALPALGALEGALAGARATAGRVECDLVLDGERRYRAVAAPVRLAGQVVGLCVVVRPAPPAVAAAPDISNRARDADETRPIRRVGRPRRPGRRVLVIEDNRDAAETLRELIELDGHSVEVAFDGPEGLARAHAVVPEVVVCDLGMPTLDGFAIARALRADPRLDGTLLVALSGYARPEDVARARAAGFDHHLAKPPSLQVLLRVVGEGRPGATASG